MKEKNDFLPLKVAISFYADDIVCSRQDALKAMDEYAEEYAKAAVHHTLKSLANAGQILGIISETEDFFVHDFKESLKK